MSTTRIAVELRDGRACLRHVPGLLRAQQVHGPPGVCRVALVATTALLLGGDAVTVEVEVGPGARLELSEVAGTVAYHGRGAPASWRMEIWLAAGAELVVRGEPLVMADGAEVTRAIDLHLAAGASALVRDTVVFGRQGEMGGRLSSHTAVRREGRDVLVEDTDLAPGLRRLPGLLGGYRVIDSLLAVGAEPGPVPPTATRLTLNEPGSSLTRFLGRSLADSPLAPPVSRGGIAPPPRREAGPAAAGVRTTPATGPGLVRSPADQSRTTSPGRPRRAAPR